MQFAAGLLLCFGSLVAVGSTVHRSDVQRRAVAGISAPGSDVDGWRALPAVPGASINQVPVGGRNATLTTYMTDESSYDASKILRAVIMVSGINRVAWNEWIFLNASLVRASQGGDFDPATVVLAAPQFNILQDAGAYPVDADGAPTSSTLVWSDKDWGAGNDAVFPDKALMAGLPYGAPLSAARRRERSLKDPSALDGPGVGSFDALDSLIDIYLNRTQFPNLNRVVVSGFSLGSQLVQRYALLRRSSDDDDRLTFWICAPGSFLYLNATRPANIGKRCSSTFNEFKYGLQGKVPAYVRETPTAETLGNRLASLTVRYLVGLTDTISGDNSCEANAQGLQHISKMLNWVQRVAPYLPGASQDGSLPANTSLSLIRGVGHDDGRVIQSDPGVVTLFLEDYPSAGRNATAPPSNGDGAGTAAEASGAMALVGRSPLALLLLVPLLSAILIAT
ncbi:hypothetical protein V8E36_003228 [Tilletia maclaganii]